jgi:hypothetical protein
MSSLRDRVKELKQEIIIYHKQSHLIIYNRDDVGAPLSFMATEKITELDAKCAELNRKILALEIAIAEDKLKKREVVPLKEAELLVLTVVNKRDYDKFIESKTIVEATGLERNRIYEILRGFIIAGLVKYGETSQGKVKGYRATQNGLAYLKSCQ